MTSLLNKLNIQLPNSNIQQLSGFLKQEDSFSKVSSILRPVTRNQGQAGTLAKQALHELESIFANAETMGLKLEVFDSCTQYNASSRDNYRLRDTLYLTVFH